MSHYRNEVKEQLLRKHIIPHLRRQASRDPVLFAFMTGMLHELQDFPKFNILAIERSGEQIASMIATAAKSEYGIEITPGGGFSEYLVDLYNGDQRCSILRGDITRNTTRAGDVIITRMKELAYELANGGWAGNGISSIWYDHCGTMDKAFKGLQRLKYACSCIIKKIPVAVTFCKRYETPVTLRECNAWAAQPYEDPFLEEMAKKAKIKSMDFKLEFSELFHYRGTNDAHMGVALGHFRR